MSSIFSQFLLLLWKNYKLQSRKKAVTVFEIILPVLFAIILLVMRILAQNVTNENYTTYISNEVPSNYVFSSYKSLVLYMPKNDFTTRIVSNIAEYSRSGKNFTGVDSEQELVNIYNQNSDVVLAGIVFLSDTENLPLSSLDYKIRMPTEKYSDGWHTGSTYDLINAGGPQRQFYDYEEFVRLQYIINEAFIKEFNSSAFDRTDFEVHRMPYPPYSQGSLIENLSFMMPLFIVLSFLLNVLQMAKNITYEKENKLKESMKMMGLKTSVYWLSWFVKNLIYLLVVAVLYTIICFIDTENGRLIQYTSPSLFFVFFLLYILATIAFSFMISTFFKKATSASYAAGILYFVTYVPKFFLDSLYDSMTYSQKMLTCLLHNMGMSLGVTTILVAETAGTGYNWSNFHQPGQIGDNLSLLDAMIMLVVDTVIYMLIAWYVDNVNPGDVGVAQPMWFPFSPTFWCGSKTEDSGYEGRFEVENNPKFEQDRSGAKVGISVEHLRKRFSGTVAVDDVTLKMYEGQITALLGHNGAGKTTTISMLTGFLKPSGGRATINGKDIRTNMDDIRQSLGLCPQHNILFEILTVEEHLVFFAKLKGCPRSQVNKAVNEMIEATGLQQKRHALAGTLSGGQKRKLSVGIALIAGSEIILLDEPTSGMDPAARRQTWDILQRFRAGRTIILTTHFMDEADILGDRIAIMAHGSIQCCGTSMFLKKLYGAGYHLVIVKDRNCDVNGLTELIQRFIPAANIQSHISSEITFLLPFNESEKFEALFNEIEAKMSSLGIQSFGTSATTMEEVFLKVGEGVTKDENDDNKERRKKTKRGVNGDGGDASSAQSNDGNGGTKEQTNRNNYLLNVEAGDITAAQSSESIDMMNMTSTNFIDFNQGYMKNTGFLRVMQQFYAIFVKKFLHSIRNLAITLAQLILPIVFAILALSAIKANESSDSKSPSLALDLHPWSRYTVPYRAGYFGAMSVSEEMANRYKNQFGDNAKEVVGPMEEFFRKEITDVGLATFNKEYIIGGEFNHDNQTDRTILTAHFNGQPYHAMAISLQYLMNGFLQYVTKNPSNHITVMNHPLPKVTDSNPNNRSGLDLSIAVLVVFGMAFMTATFSMFYIKERSIGAKHLQTVSGIGPITYWMSSFAWDFLNYVIPVLVILIVFAGFQVTVYVDRLGYVFFVFLLYGWAVLPSVYLLQLMFSKPPTGFILISLLNIVTGFVFLSVIMVLLGMKNTKEAGEGLEWFCLILFPNYNLGHAILNIFMLGISCTYCQELDNCCPDIMGMKNPSIGRDCLFLFIQGVVFMAFVLIIELGIFRRLFMSSMKSGKEQYMQVAGDITQDSDVAEERDRINATDIQKLKQSESVILKNVSKIYGNGFQAVKKVSCGIQANECFGLLGQNGAGKSTTFKMLTGEEMITSGDAYLNDLSLKSDLKQVHQNMGYCPQFDALIDQMTGRETLYMYARLRGIKNSHIPRIVNQLVEVLMLTEHIDKKTSHYSGGNKRKLSTAISLIGDPPFIFLDEPTTGLDPVARRQLWNVIAGVRASGRTVVLISHSMEECDALCTKLVIMVNGNFVCLGSPQHLKNKFGHGYTLLCKMGLTESGETASSQPLANFILNTFSGSSVFDDNTGYVHFKIPEDVTRLGQIFGVMERSKREYMVEDYSVHQTSLEQIFLMFVKNQIPPVETKPNCCVRCGCLCFTLCC